jgi:hypothetical protein
LAPTCFEYSLHEGSSFVNIFILVMGQW